MNLNIDPAAVEKLVADAIVQSALGEKVKKAVADSLGASWNNPVEQAVALSVQAAAKELVRTEFLEVIREAVRAKMTTEYVGKLVDNVTQKLVDNSY